MKLKGKVTIVTGAGRGIGKAIALAFAEEGADVIVVSRNLSEVEETAAQIKALGRRALALRADVSKKEEVACTVDSAIKEFGGIDILVNNAGIQGPIGPMVGNDIERWVETINVNLIGTFLCTKAVLPFMIERRQGKIINLSGGGATSPRPYFSAYASSKAAVVRLTETLAEELKPYNIQVNAIAPGAVNTRLLDEVLEAGEVVGKQELTKAIKQKQEGGVPPEKVAELAVFLASSKSDGLSGRLISLLWDSWREIPKHLSDIMSSDIYTMRRIIPKDRGCEF
jgi:NAD(P)-dependent dehydrogenase (short-subunit alcohol dehydrogenase family)